MIKVTKEIRGYLGGGLLLTSIIILLFFLAFYEIPETNNDVFKVILGVLLAQLPKAVAVFVGKEDDNYIELKKKYDEVLKQNELMAIEIGVLKEQLALLNERVVEKISVLSEKK